MSNQKVAVEQMIEALVAARRILTARDNEIEAESKNLVLDPSGASHENETEFKQLERDQNEIQREFRRVEGLVEDRAIALKHQETSADVPIDAEAFAEKWESNGSWWNKRDSLKTPLAEQIETMQEHYDKILSSLALRYDFRREVRWTAFLTVACWIVLYLIFAVPNQFVRSLENVQKDGLAEVATGYAARVAGTVPVTCLAKINSAPADPEPEYSDWTRFGTPLALRLLWQEDESDTGKLCVWRDKNSKKSYIPLTIPEAPKHLLAAISPDVGLIQKISIFVFILGWRLVGRARMDLELTEGRLALGRGPAKEEAQIFPRGIVAVTGNAGLSVKHPNKLNSELKKEEGNNNEPKQIDEPFNKYVEDLQEMRGSQKNKRLLRDSLWQLTVNYIAELAGEAQLRYHRDQVVDRSTKRADSLREDVYRQFSVPDYVVWLLPTVGFLGTIYGISTSLIRARAIFSGGVDQNEFGAVVDALGTAFDTTAFALLLLAFLMARKMQIETWLSATVDWVATMVREHLVTQLQDMEYGRDCDIIEQANAVIKRQDALSQKLSGFKLHLFDEGEELE
ncbi:MotA/TolQ/ExbB proton channel family protein [Ruegeria sp. HKCCA6948]|uniref:MotA/TolQ/ExbB proton channel family protein n=1 Tax=Ruegeria sp. HKCCA6948 TaxID=2682997 RepID=UPI001489F4AD|nr:MotA/TolQ/ExbB proton channel family protein [Ruegeria sp. HKCCA6948]